MAASVKHGLNNSASIPPLESGDRLTCHEFERRYTAMPLDLDNEPQPDVLLLIEKPARGQAYISEDDYIEGAPELVAEVAASSASIDLYDKKRAYRRNGVQEYIVWQTLENKLNWFSLQNGEYLPLVADADGVIKSKIFPGLWLAVTSLITGDMTTVLAVLQQGLNSKEHTEFVARLVW